MEKLPVLRRFPCSFACERIKHLPCGKQQINGIMSKTVLAIVPVAVKDRRYNGIIAA